MSDRILRHRCAARAALPVSEPWAGLGESQRQVDESDRSHTGAVYSSRASVGGQAKDPLRDLPLWVPWLYGASISSILPSRVRWRIINLPLGSRKTKTSRSRKWASLMASSRVMGRMATASSERTRWTSVVLATGGYRCTATGTAVFSVRPTLVCVPVPSSCGEWPFHFFTSSLLRAERFLDCQRVLYFTACFSRWSRAS